MEIWLIGTGSLCFLAGFILATRLFNFWFKKFLNGELSRETYNRVFESIGELPLDED